jgi:maltooligosyltrehalose trehalohydrolase
VTVLGDKALVARWRLGDGSWLSIWLNLGEEPVVVDCDGGAMIHASQPGAIATLAAGTLPEHCCVTCLQHP